MATKPKMQKPRAVLHSTPQQITRLRGAIYNAPNGPEAGEYVSDEMVDLVRKAGEFAALYVAGARV
jgi:hypothetical protein